MSFLERFRSLYETNRQGFGVVGGTFVVAIISFGLASLFPGTKDGQTVAAWFQAVGSIAAIIGAFWMGERQAVRARAHAEGMELVVWRRRQDAYRAVAEHGIAQINAVRHLVEKHDEVNALAFFLQYDGPLFSESIDAMKAVPLHELGSYEAVKGFIKLKEALAAVVKNVDKYFGPDAEASEKNRRQFTIVMRQVILRAEEGFATFIAGQHLA